MSQSYKVSSSIPTTNESKFVRVTDSFNFNENRTKEYIQKIDVAFSAIVGKNKIDMESYSNFVLNLPGDLACKLRMVPDSNLPSRLSHLFEIYMRLISGARIANISKYFVVSIEGSNRNIPFDCDLVIMSYFDESIHFIDFTSSESTALKAEKESVLKSNIEKNDFINSFAHVEVFKSRNIEVDIEQAFTSNEPGTIGLRIMDAICSLDSKAMNNVIDRMKEVFESTNDSLTNLNMSEAPGDYKTSTVTDSLSYKALNLVKTQSDMDSLNLLEELDNLDSANYPYYKSLYNLAKISHKFKKIVPIEGSQKFESRDLQSNLASLEDNWLIRGLHAATLTENVVAVDDADNLEFLADFPCSKADKVLPVLLKYKACIKQKKDHVFTIKFNPLHIDEKLRRVLLNENNYKNKRAFADDDEDVSRVVRDYVTRAVSDYSEDHKVFTSINIDSPKDNIWKKIQTISALASNDLENFGRSTCTLLDNFLSMMDNLYIGACVSHFYEVNKSILASLKVSPGDSDYYVGINGSYNSVTIVKMSSTLDSFSKTNYCVIFKQDRNAPTRRTRLDGSSTNGIFATKFYSIDPNQLSYNLKLPMIISSFATWEIENNLDKGSIQSGKTLQIIFDSSIAALVNRDQFAQVSEQVRYFYMSSIGYGGSSADIAEKTTFITTRHSWEVLYLLRSFKMSACLVILSTSKMLPNLENKETTELEVAFPHTMYPSRSFSQTISSMYVCNIYNKFRAFHEVSDAICYNAIIEELDIYRSRVSEDENAVSGISPTMTRAFKSGKVALIDYIMSSEFIQEESDFNISLAVVKSNRYSGSLTYIMGSTAYMTETPSSVIDSIYQKLSFCPIEACTMRGSMDTGPSVESNQGLRAASAVLEEIIRQYNLEPDSVNKSVLGAASLFDRMTIDNKNFSIFMFVLMQFCLIVDAYRYRIVDKDQKGHREISVLNFLFRIGALFVETISRELSFLVGDVDVVHNSNKDKIVEDAIKTAFTDSRLNPGGVCFDNTDQKRWGPNHNVNFFSYFLTVMLKKEPGLARMVIKVFDKVFDKRAKFPEPLIKLVLTKKLKTSRSKPIDFFIKTCAEKMNNQIFETIVPQGMCQGIFHDTSSISHALKVKATGIILTTLEPSLKIHYFTTSDDGHGIIHIAKGQNMVETIKVVHVAGLRLGNLFNIVRSNPKSAFNFRIAELNSNFYKRGTMATPSLKQRISKIDVGFGVNHVEDYLSVLSASANYLSSGGSYMGSYIISILNLTLHTEQWLRWEFAKSDHYYKPVEVGGFPVIEPISTVISGAISNMYLRSGHVLSPEHYSRLIVNTLLCKPEKIALSDFTRSGSEQAKISYKADDLTVFKGTGPFGLFQTVRTDRKLSVFERRHGISKWIVPESFVNLNRTSADATDFLFTLFRNTSVNTLDTNLGVNSFYVRFAEPWVSYNRKCFIVSKDSPFAPDLGGAGARISHREMSESFRATNILASTVMVKQAFSRCVRHNEFEILEAQLTVRLQDSMSLSLYMREQEAEYFRESVTSPSIQTITLKGHSASDSDAYFLAIVKSLSGKKSKHLINSYRKSYGAYDSIIISEPSEPASLLDTIVFADNAVSIYNKFIKRDTKMIIPNKVDDMRQLCIDILRNKFTEHLGISTTGKLELGEDRLKMFAYTKWYQELIRLSEKREEALSSRALASVDVDPVKVNIKVSRGLITKRDMFEISNSFEPERTVLLSCPNKSVFVSTLKSWLAAKVKFVIDRSTLSNLISGKLTFGHDYYMGNSKFFRHPKTQYMRISARSSVGTHFIETKTVNIRGKNKTRYDHIFLFRDNINNAKVTATLTKPLDENRDAWLKKLTDSINSNDKVTTNKWYDLPSNWESKTRGKSYRITKDETDRYMFVSVSPATEFRLEPADETLTICLACEQFKLPVTYATPIDVKEMRSTVRLTDLDFKAAVKAYENLRARANGFSKASVRSNKPLRDFLDFVLVESTMDTPDQVISSKCKTSNVPDLTTEQLDIVRTMLVNNKDVGVNFSSHRFSGSLLNMGKRRNHNHSFFTRRITGERVEYDSEEMSEASEADEMVPLGESNERHVMEDIAEDDVIIPNYLANNNTAPNVDSTSNHDEPLTDWAEEVENEIVRTTISNIREQDAVTTIALHHEESIAEENFQTVSDVDLFSDTVSDELSENAEEDDSDNEVDMGMINAAANLNSSLPGITTTSNLNPESNAINALFSQILVTNHENANNPIDYKAIFNFDDDEVPMNGAAVNEEVKLSSLDALFTEALKGTYGKIKDEKDKALKSIITGHTVNGNLESPRAIIRYLKSWLETAGKIKEFDFIRESESNVTKITAVYLMLNSYGALSSVNPLENMYGRDYIDLPVELSTLAVVNAMYI